MLRDLGSKNGIEVGGQRVADPRLLRDGEVVRLGKTRLRVVDPEERYLRQMELGDAAAPPALEATSAKTSAEDKAPARSRLPLIAGAIAVTALFLALGLVLALALAV